MELTISANLLECRKKLCEVHMRKSVMLALCYFLMASALSANDGIIGLWKTFNDKSGKPESIIGVYEYQGKYYGRIIGSYNGEGKMDDSINLPKDRATGVEGHPYYSGLDIIWNLQKDGEKYTNGKIMDPQKGRIYDAQMWNKDGNLIVRGEIWLFGQNITWVPAQERDFPVGFKKPDLASFVPSIQKVIHETHKRERNRDRVVEGKR